MANEPQVVHVVGLGLAVETRRRSLREIETGHMTHKEMLRLAGELSKRVGAPFEECLHTIQTRAVRAEKAIAAIKEYALWPRELGHEFKL